MPLRNKVIGVDALRGLSENDVSTLRDLVSWWRAQVVNTRQRPNVPEPLAPTPETYVVLTPPGGIPAMGEYANDETGTGTHPITGTGLEVDNPGFATCKLYQRFALTNELQDLGFTEVVYNLSLDAVAGNRFVLAARTKEGDLMVVAGSGGGGGIAVAWVQDGIPAMTEAETGTGSIDVDNPGSATCPLYVRNPGTDELTATGSEVTVYNANLTAVAGNRYVIVGQDSVGDWYVLSGVLDVTVVASVSTSCVGGVPVTTTQSVRIRLP